jgi:hypothetical protein
MGIFTPRVSRETTMSTNQVLPVMLPPHGSLWTKNDLDTNEGAFEVTAGANTITGTFDSATGAPGSFSESNAGCAGDWTATPVEE